MRRESSFFALSSSALRDALRPRPPRLMKYVSMRIPEAGPLGETSFEASVRAITGALLVKRPSGGCVESVLTFLTHLFVLPDCFRWFVMTVNSKAKFPCTI